MTSKYKATIGGTIYSPSAGSNISLLEVTNSDQEYYDTGIIQSTDDYSELIIGSSIEVEIEGKKILDGYVARKSVSPIGQKLWNLQVVGRSYDLWRHLTDDDALYEDLYTTYIASSLVNSYASDDVTPNEITTDFSGAFLDSEIDLRNMTVGDALLQLIGRDNYKFRVDISGQLEYYSPSTVASPVTITEENIIDLSPPELADEDIVNVCLVKGGSDYSTTTEQLEHDYTHNLDYQSMWIAQRFTCLDDELSAVSLYMDRTVDPNQPETTTFEIWSDTETLLYDDTCDDVTYVKSSFKLQTGLDSTFLTLAKTSKYNSNPPISTSPHPQNDYVGCVFDSTDVALNNCGFYKLEKVIVYFYANWAGTLWCEVYSGNSMTTFTNVGSCMGSSSVPVSNIGDFTAKTVWFLDKNIIVSGTAGLTPAAKYWNFIFYTDNPSTKEIKIRNALYGDSTWPPKSSFTSPDKSSWTLHGTAEEDIPWLRVYFREYYSSTRWSSNQYTVDTQLIRVSAQTLMSGAYASGLLISGSNDGGATWSSLNNGEWTDLGSEGNTCDIKFKMEAGSGGSDHYIRHGGDIDNIVYVPIIDNVRVEVRPAGSTGGGEPGSKMEWSDDISLQATDLPYPPDWCEWQTYTSPKLGLSKGGYYWMVLKSGSIDTAGKYFILYYTSSTTIADDMSIQGTTDQGANWNTKAGDANVPSGSLAFKLGWKSGYVNYTATDDDSISLYGRHVKVISDSTINSYSAARIRAETEIENSVPVYKGSFTINGDTSIELDQKISSNLTNIGISGVHDVVSYTHRIDQNGYTTIINYGKQMYDIARKVSELEGEVYGG